MAQPSPSSSRTRPAARGGGRRFRLRTGVAVLATLLSAVVGTAAPAAAQADSAARATLRAAVTDAMLSRAGATRARPAADSRESRVAVERRAADGGWAFGSTVLTAPPGEHASPQGWLYLARTDGSEWDVALEGSAQFRARVRHAPEGLLSDRERSILAKVGTRDAERLGAGFANTGLTLPWAVGQVWTWTSGPHPFGVGGTGAWSSLDFSGGDGIARAARGGVAYAMCASGGYRGWLRIYHNNGLSTDYYHLVNNIKPHGAAVGAGTALGYIGNDVSCGGASSGPHVHFSLLSGDTYINVHGAVIGGWQFSAGAAPYQGTAYNGSVVVGVGANLPNYGPSLAKHGG